MVEVLELRLELVLDLVLDMQLEKLEDKKRKPDLF